MVKAPLVFMTWRTGRKVGRTIYAQRGAVPSDADDLIGVMDTRILAESTVKAHNEWLQRAVPYPSEDVAVTPCDAP